MTDLEKHSTKVKPKGPSKQCLKTEVKVDA